MQWTVRRLSTALVLLFVLSVSVSAAPVEPFDDAAAAASPDHTSRSARQAALQSSLRSLDFPFRFRGHLYTPALSASEQAAQSEGPIPIAGTIAYLNYAEHASKHRVRSMRQTPEDMPALRGSTPPELDFRPIEGQWPTLPLHRRKHFYEASIAIGSSRQPLRVVVDTALAKSWIIDSALELPLQEHQPIATFASHASSTFAARVPAAKDDDLPTPHYSSMFSGIVARDQAFLGPLAHPVLEFTLVTAMLGRQDAEPYSEAAAATGLGVALPFLWEHSGVLGLGVKPLKGTERGAGAGATPRVLNYWQRLGMNKAAVQSLRAQAAKDAKSNVCGCSPAMLGRACWCSADARKAAHEFLAKLATNPSLVNEPVLKPGVWRRRLLSQSDDDASFLQLDDGSDEPAAATRPSASDAWLGEPMTLDTLLRNEDLLRELGLEPAALGAMSDAEIDVIIDYAEAKRNELAHAKVAPKSASYENSTSPGEHRLNAIAQVAPKPLPHEHVVDHAAVPQHEKALEALASSTPAAPPAAAVKPAVVPPVKPRASPKSAPVAAPAAAAAPTPIVTPKPAATPAAPAAAVASTPKPKGSSPRSIRVKSSDVSAPVDSSSAPSLMEMSSLASFYFSPSSLSSSSANAEDDPLADGCFIPGHIDARFFTGGIHWIAADHIHASWAVGISDVLIDGVSTELCSKENTGGAGCVGALSTGSTQIRASERIMMPLIEALPVDPSCVGSSRPRTLTIVLSNGIKVDLSEDDLRDRQRAEDDGMFVRSDDDSCTSVLALDTQRMTGSVVAAATGAPEVLSLGTPFLRKFYTIFDFEGSRIGLAKPRHEWFALNGCAWEGVGLSTPALAAALAQASPKENWCAPIRSDQCPNGRNPFEHDAAATDSTSWAGTGAKVSAVSAATATLAARSARFAAKSKSDSENPQVTLAKVLTGESFFHGRDAERQREAQQRRARRNSDARARRRDDNEYPRYRKPAAAHKNTRKRTAASPDARAKAAALRDWTQPLRAPRAAAPSRRAHRRPSPVVGAHIFPAHAVPLHPRHRVLPHVISTTAPAAEQATNALHEMVLSAEEKRLSAEAEKLLKAEALKHPAVGGSGQAPAAMIPALSPANHRVSATPRSVLRAAGMDPRAMRTTPEGLPAALPRFVARDPFDLNGYGVEDILPAAGLESATRTAVDETIGEALQSIRQMEATLPSQAQLAAQQGYGARIGALEDVVAAAQERVDNTEEDRAVREAESKAMQGLLQRAGDQALLESPVATPAAPAPASSAAARLQQVKQIMRNMQHARAMRSGSTPQGSRHPVPATASHAPAAQHSQQPDDTAQQFMPSWKKMLFRN